MKTRRDVWRERLILWLPALLFFLANLVVFSSYRLVFAGQAQLRELRVERRSEELARLEVERAGLEEVVGRARRTRERVATFYDSWLTTERLRLTRVIAEVKELARRAGVEPAVVTYPGEEIEDHGLVKRSIVFAVDGSYVELRTFINFLELSELFLTLDEVSLSEAAGQGSLRIQLKLSTLFVDESAAARPGVTS